MFCLFCYRDGNSCSDFGLCSEIKEWSDIVCNFITIAFKVKERAKKSIIQESQITDLKNQIESAQHDISIWKKRYETLFEQTKEFIEAIKRAPEKVKAFIHSVLHSEKISIQSHHKHRKNEIEH